MTANLSGGTHDRVLPQSWGPVKRGLVQSPEDLAWSSFRHYVSGVEGVVEIESQWTARKREQMGVAVG